LAATNLVVLSEVCRPHRGRRRSRRTPAFLGPGSGDPGSSLLIRREDGENALRRPC